MTALPPAFAETLRDRYVLQRELGHGGMATVYLARDLKHDRLVALKVLHPELAATLGPERFLREGGVAEGSTCAGTVPEQETTADYRGQQDRGTSPTVTTLTWSALVCCSPCH